MYLEGVLIHELGGHVEVLKALLDQLHLVAPVQLLDVSRHIIPHLLPGMLSREVNLKPALLLVLPHFTKESGEMHQLFRNTADVHASPAQTPLGASWARPYKVGKSNIGAQSFGRLCAS